MKFKIYRDSWLRGSLSWRGCIINSYLHRSSDDLECCLGQITMQCGLKISNIADKCLPSDLRITENDLFESVRNQLGEFTCHHENKNDPNHTPLCVRRQNDIAVLNDDHKYSDEEREASLKLMFTAAGLEVEFVDGVAPWIKDK
jgi:hypothetical protein